MRVGPDDCVALAWFFYCCRRLLHWINSTSWFHAIKMYMHGRLGTTSAAFPSGAEFRRRLWILMDRRVRYPRAPHNRWRVGDPIFVYHHRLQTLTVVGRTYMLSVGCRPHSLIRASSSRVYRCESRRGSILAMLVTSCFTPPVTKPIRFPKRGNLMEPAAKEKILLALSVAFLTIHLAALGWRRAAPHNRLPLREKARAFLRPILGSVRRFAVGSPWVRQRDRGKADGNIHIGH